MAESYRTSQCKFFWGNASTVVDLTPHIESLSLSPTNVVDRRMRITGTGSLGVTADSVSSGLSGAATVRLHADTKSLPNDGILMIHRQDCDRVIAIPMTMTAKPTAAPSDGAVTIALTFTQRASSGAVEGAQVTSGNVVAATGKVGYVKGTNIKLATGTTAVPNSGVGVIDSPLEADNS